MRKAPRDRPVRARSVKPQVVDLTRSKRRAAAYKLLVSVWWPHVMHGDIALGTDEERGLAQFKCQCGDCFILPLVVVQEAGIVPGFTAVPLERTTALH